MSVPYLRHRREAGTGAGRQSAEGDCVDTVEIVGLVISGITGLYYFIQYVSPDAASRPTSLIGPESLPSEQQLPPGFVLDRRKNGWTLTSAPRNPCRIRAEARWQETGHPTGELRVEVEGTGPIPESVARLFAGEVSGWRWTGDGWEYRLGRAADLILGDAVDREGILNEAIGRLAEAQLLHRRTQRAFAFGPEIIAALEAPARADLQTLTKLGHTLVVEVAQSDPAFAVQLARHMGSPALWLVMIEDNKTAAAAYAALLGRGANDPFEAATIERALQNPVELDGRSLELLFHALEKRADARLAPLLTQLLPIANRSLLLIWLERHGDASALEPLEGLLEHCAPESRAGIERAISAIRFRREAALSHTVGGLSIQEEGGGLALSEGATAGSEAKGSS